MSFFGFGFAKQMGFYMGLCGFIWVMWFYVVLCGLVLYMVLYGFICFVMSSVFRQLSENKAAKPSPE